MMYTNIRKELAGKKGLTQALLARKIGISVKSLNNKLNGKTDFTLTEMRKIQSNFDDLPLDYLFKQDTA